MIQINFSLMIQLFTAVDHIFSTDHNRLKTKINDKVSIAGWKNGLTVVLDSKIEDFAVPYSRSNGFKVLVHAPADYAQVEELGFNISPGFETFAGIAPRKRSISEDVDSLPQAKRSCFRTRDKTLQFYNKFSFSNCMVECLTQHMLSTCKCRPFFLPGKVFIINKVDRGKRRKVTTDYISSFSF